MNIGKKCVKKIELKFLNACIYKFLTKFSEKNTLVIMIESMPWNAHIEYIF